MPAGQAVTITASVPHGHVAAVHAMAVKLGLPALLGPACPQRDLALALVISRVVAPASKLSTLAWWADTTLALTWGSPAPPPMTSTRRWTGWPAGRTRSRRSWPPGTWRRSRTRRGWRCSTCPARGWRAALPAGRPRLLPRRQEGQAADRVRAAHRPGGPPGRGPGLPGNTGDPAAFTEIVQVVRDKFGLGTMVMVGDRGMITSARIAALNQLEDGTQRPDAYGWITALRAPAIKKLMAERRPAADVPVRSAEPGRDHQPGLPRRAADRLPQPRPGRRPRPHPRRAAGRHRETAGPDHRPRPGRAAHRRRGDRRRGRQGDQQIQDRQALRPSPSPTPA